MGSLHVTAVQGGAASSCLCFSYSRVAGVMLSLLRPEGMQSLFPLPEPGGPEVGLGEPLA